MRTTDANKEQLLRTTCAATLVKVPTDLNYPLAGHRISYQGLQGIAHDIVSGSLSVRFFDPANPPEDKFGRAALPMPLVLHPNTIAWYACEDKRLTLTRQPNSVPEKATLVHECVHALLHNNRLCLKNRPKPRLRSGQWTGEQLQYALSN